MSGSDHLCRTVLQQRRVRMVYNQAELQIPTVRNKHNQATPLPSDTVIENSRGCIYNRGLQKITIFAFRFHRERERERSEKEESLSIEIRKASSNVVLLIVRF